MWVGSWPMPEATSLGSPPQLSGAQARAITSNLMGPAADLAWRDSRNKHCGTCAEGRDGTTGKDGRFRRCRDERYAVKFYSAPRAHSRTHPTTARPRRIASSVCSDLIDSRDNSTVVYRSAHPKWPSLLRSPATPSSARCSRRPISWISWASITSGGANTSRSPTTRRISPRRAAAASTLPPTLSALSNAIRFSPSRISSMPRINPMPRTSPTNGCDCNRPSVDCRTGPRRLVRPDVQAWLGCILYG
jgi:hypothetical protein